MSKCGKIYCDYFDYGDQDRKPCQIPGCMNEMGGPHHILPKSLGGKDVIENLMGLCQTHHESAHAHKLSRDYLESLHIKFMKR